MAGRPGENPKTDDLFFGKYKNREEAETGFRNLVGHADQIKAENAALRSQLTQLSGTVAALQAAVAQPRVTPEAPPPLTDEEGKLNPNALMQAINAPIAAMQQAMAKIPDLVNESVANILRPISSAADASKAFFQRPDVDAGFTPESRDALLRRNPGIAGAYESLMANPETQGRAHEVVYDFWKATKPTSGVNPRDKRDATEPTPTGGPSLPSPETKESVEEMAKMAAVAQDNLAPEAQIAFARKWIQGSKVEKKIATAPEDWDLETPDSESLVG